MTKKFLTVHLFLLVSIHSFSQELDTSTLDDYFETLERRSEAMGSLTIAKNGIIIYTKAIGHRYQEGKIKIPATTATNYRIWSITKLYTATMIMQLVEEGKLTLDTNLDRFFPGIPNSERIAIKDMLNHKSGIHDFIQNDSSEDWDTNITETLTQKFMVEHIAQYEPDFPPNTGFRYSNSNYLLLGYIIETLDGNPYETSLQNRISSKLGLKSTFFGVGALDSIENKAFSYAREKQWKPVDEGEFSGLIPAGAGGIVSTTKDMSLFIQGLYSGRLVSKESLNAMMPRDEFYGLGIMQTTFQDDKKGYGHTGGFIATESSLFYYPEDGVSIAYATNGIVIRKEEILENVLKIYHGQPFGISMNRIQQTLLIFGLFVIFFLIMKPTRRRFVKIENLGYLGYGIVILFWVGTFIAGHLYGSYSFIKDGVTNLDSFYSGSGTFMSGTQITIGLLLLPYIHGILKNFRRLGFSMLPLVPLGILPISLIGSSLFPFPDALYQIFINAILIVMIGPLLALLLWRKKELSKLRVYSALCLIFMLISMLLVIQRPSIPEFVHNYWGLIQRSFYLGWTLWLCFISAHVLKLVPSTIRE